MRCYFQKRGIAPKLPSITIETLYFPCRPPHLQQFSCMLCTACELLLTVTGPYKQEIQIQTASSKPKQTEAVRKIPPMNCPQGCMQTGLFPVSYTFCSWCECVTDPVPNQFHIRLFSLPVQTQLLNFPVPVQTQLLDFPVPVQSQLRAIPTTRTAHDLIEWICSEHTSS
jgi:hypothetical protein